MHHAGLLLLTIKAQRDEEMINAWLRFIMENADLNRKSMTGLPKSTLNTTSNTSLNRTHKPVNLNM